MIFEPLKILLVEDSPTDALIIQEALSDAPFANLGFHHVERVVDAIDVLRMQSFDVVLLDLGLPDSTGIDTFITVQGGAPGIPTVILTSLADQEVASKALQLGAQDYLLKGEIDSSSLAKAVRYAIERQRLERRMRARTTHYQVLLDIAENALVAKSSIEEIMALALKSARSTLKNAYAELFEFSSEEDCLELSKSLGPAGFSTEERKLRINQESPEGKAVVSGRAVVIEDMESHPEIKRDYPNRGRIRSGIWVPIILRDKKVFGTISVFDSSPKTYLPEELEFFQRLAALLGKIIVASRPAN